MNTQRLGKSQREKDTTRVVSVAAFKDGKLLFGLRGDTGKWNFPGGHVEPGEGLDAAARRELLEETGLKAKNLEPLGFCDVKDGLRVYSFKTDVEGEPSADADPDEEMVAFKWLEPMQIPKSVMGNLHNKKDVTLQFLDIQDRDLELIWDEDAPSLKELKKGVGQRLWPFNPSEVSDADKAKVQGQQSWGEPRDRKAVPELPENARQRALHRLHGKAEARRNPTTGEREFLLRRGVDEREAARGSGGKIRYRARSSWTPHLDMAEHLGEKFSKHPEGAFSVLSAWVPESKIHSILPQFGETRQGPYSENVDGKWEQIQHPRHPPGPNEMANEYEVIVHPHQFELAEPADTELTNGALGLGKSDDLAKAQADLNTPEFHSWFQGSKVADHEGKPLRLYHGTSKDADFSSFKIGQRGAWFTTDPVEAGKYATSNDSQNLKAVWGPKGLDYVNTNTSPRIIPVHLSLKNPYRMTEKDSAEHSKATNYQQHQRALFARLRADGHDGVDFGNGTYVAFHPHQIKSIFNTKPTANKAIHKSEPYDPQADAPDTAETAGDTSFDFGANAPAPDAHAEVKQVISRMMQPKRQSAEAFLHYVKNHPKLPRPAIDPELERHLARYGLVDPDGYDFGEDGRSLLRRIPGKRGAGERQPDHLKRHREMTRLYDPLEMSEMEKTEEPKAPEAAQTPAAPEPAATAITSLQHAKSLLEDFDPVQARKGAEYILASGPNHGLWDNAKRSALNLLHGDVTDPSTGEEAIRNHIKEATKHSLRSHLVDVAGKAHKLPHDLHEELALRHGDTQVQTAAINRQDTPAYILDWAVSNGIDSDDYFSGANHAAAHRNLSPAGQLLATRNSSLASYMTGGEAREHLHPDTIKRLMDVTGEGHEPLTNARRALNNQHEPLPADVIEYGLRHPNPRVRGAMATVSEQLSREQRLQLVGDQDEEVSIPMMRRIQDSHKEDLVDAIKASPHPVDAQAIDSVPESALPELITNHGNHNVRTMALQRLLRSDTTDPEQARHFAAMAVGSKDSPFMRELGLAHHSITAETLTDHANRPDLTGPEAEAIIRNRNVTPQHMAALANDPHRFGDHARYVTKRIASHARVAPETLTQLATSPDAHWDAIKAAINNPKIPVETLRELAGHEDDTIRRDLAREKLKVHDPDSAFDEKVSFGLGTNRLRQVRDAVLASDKPQHKNNLKQVAGVDLTPFTKPGTALVSPDKLQEAIDQKHNEGLTYNVSHSTWDGAQRHNDENSRVFQLNLTTDTVNKLKQEGLYDTFKEMQGISQSSQHPIHQDHGLGWVRYTQASRPLKEEECLQCDGSGTYRPEPSTCEECNGDGHNLRNCESCDGSGRTEVTKDCDHCDGTGSQEIDGEKAECGNCNGEGHTKEEEYCDSCDGDGEVREHCSSCGGDGSIENEEQECDNCGGKGKLNTARYVGNKPTKDKDHFFVDEIQSDFGQDFGKVLSTNTRLDSERRHRERGLTGRALQEAVDADMASADEELAKYPPEKTKRISEILFQGRHSNEVLAEAFMQHLRDKGHAGSSVRMHSADSKSGFSLGRTGTKWVDPATNKRVDLDQHGDRIRQPTPEQEQEWASKGFKQVKDIPAHMLNTYENIPKKLLGMAPAKYGEGGFSNEDGEDFDDHRIWHTRLSKGLEFSLDAPPAWDEWVLEDATESFAKSTEVWLAKATRAQDFKSIVKATTGDGPRLVDHKSQLQAHPSSHNPVVEHYHNEVVNGSKVYKPMRGVAAAGKDEGITRKVIFGTDTGRDQHQFMVKPYHEGTPKRLASWQKFPLQGWAEMANQALYHAAGLGDLHQRVHVAEHDMGDGKSNEPALVIHMEKGLTPAYKFDGGHKTEKVKDDAMKIGLMDFLSNNLDRHGGNLMVDLQQVPVEGAADKGWGKLADTPRFRTEAKRLLSIDHGRSFQYVNNHHHKWDSATKLKKINNLEDTLYPYLFGTNSFRPASALFLGKTPRDYDTKLDFMSQRAQPAFDWWEQVGSSVRSEFQKQLQHVKDPEVRAHINRNFNARADWLDERAKMGIENYGVDFFHDPVIQYHSHQRSDQELEAEKDARARAEWEKEAAERGIKP